MKLYSDFTRYIEKLKNLESFKKFEVDDNLKIKQEYYAEVKELLSILENYSEDCDNYFLNNKIDINFQNSFLDLSMYGDYDIIMIMKYAFKYFSDEDLKNIVLSCLKRLNQLDYKNYNSLIKTFYYDLTSNDIEKNESLVVDFKDNFLYVKYENLFITGYDEFIEVRLEGKDFEYIKNRFIEINPFLWNETYQKNININDTQIWTVEIIDELEDEIKIIGNYYFPKNWNEFLMLKEEIIKRTLKKIKLEQGN